MKKAIIVAAMALVLIVPSVVLAKGGFSGGGRGFSSSRSYSAPKTTTTRSTTTTRTTAPAVRSTAPTVRTTAPASKSLFGGSVKTSSTYKPVFSRGYTPPTGSTVIYQSTPWYQYLPLWYLLTHDSTRDVTVKEPATKDASGKEVPGKTVKTQEQGTDGMYIFNWIITILLVCGMIGGIVYLVNQKTSTPSGGAYA